MYKRNKIVIELENMLLKSLREDNEYWTRKIIRTDGNRIEYRSPVYNNVRFRIDININLIGAELDNTLYYIHISPIKKFKIKKFLMLIEERYRNIENDKLMKNIEESKKFIGIKKI